MKNVLLFIVFFSLLSFVKGQEQQPQTQIGVEKVIKATYFDKTKPLRDTPPIPPGQRKRSWKNDLIGNESVENPPINMNTPENEAAIDPVVQDRHVASNEDYWPLYNFMGLGNVNGVFPPDTEGDVGPNHYFLMINSSFAIYDKSGIQLYGAADNSTIWDGFIGSWTGTNDGDPIVLYDEMADRWFVSQFAVSTSDGTFWELVAISETGDPLGAYYRYAFEFPYFNDYPKFGVWPSGYLGTFNYFNGGSMTYRGAGAVVLEREAMLAGSADAQMIMFGSNSSKYTIQPADVDGTPPPDGEPAYFAHMNTTGNKQFEIWKAIINWDTPASSSYTLANSLAVETFNPSLSTIPQPNTTQKLSAIPGVLMFRLQYRNFGTYQTLVANHTVNVSSRAAIRWYEMRKTGTNWSVYQQGTYSPDNDFRWMGSIAMNANGNIALGYSVSSATTYPSIRYTGRTANAPLGTMNIPETVIVDGQYAQTNVDRWGDYSFLGVDPADDSTFWYTTMYRLSSNWRTRIASFNLAPGAAPTVDAGPDAYMCINTNTYNLKGSGTGLETVLWTTAGDGIILNNDRLQTLYAPGATDRTSGQVTLTLTGTGWNGQNVSDTFTLFVNGLPQAMAGNDTLVCRDESIELAGHATYADSTIWHTSGDGVFDDPNLLNAVYTPGLQDIASGTATLTLDVFANDVCSGSASDALVLTVDDCTSVSENPESIHASIIPNPSNGYFNLKVANKGANKLSWQLLNLDGKTVKRGSLKSSNAWFEGQFNIENLPKGTYYLQMTIGKNNLTESIILQ
ncbi:MAG: T9SS type A sorting domain-containing protein [Bacteroidetes bacterium]|nr:T9SS type A sorting domain-containing protein [Bacteroidota bacterium]